jgi:hypothetical protein
VRRLKRSLNGNPNIISLVLGERGQVALKSIQVERSDLLVEILGKDVDLARLVLVISLV